MGEGERARVRRAAERTEIAKKLCLIRGAVVWKEQRAERVMGECAACGGVRTSPPRQHTELLRNLTAVVYLEKLQSFSFVLRNKSSLWFDCTLC